MSITIKRKGWLPEDTQMRYRIISTLVNAQAPQTISDIAKTLHTSRQSVAHHIPQMIEAGLIIKLNGHIQCQKLLYNADNLYTKIGPLVAEFITKMDYSQCKDKAQAVTENLTCFFALMTVEEK